MAVDSSRLNAEKPNSPEAARTLRIYDQQRALRRGAVPF